MNLPPPINKNMPRKVGPPPLNKMKINRPAIKIQALPQSSPTQPNTETTQQTEQKSTREDNITSGQQQNPSNQNKVNINENNQVKGQSNQLISNQGSLYNLISSNDQSIGGGYSQSFGQQGLSVEESNLKEAKFEVRQFAKAPPPPTKQVLKPPIRTNNIGIKKPVKPPQLPKVNIGNQKEETKNQTFPNDNGFLNSEQNNSKKESNPFGANEDKIEDSKSIVNEGKNEKQKEDEQTDQLKMEKLDNAQILGIGNSVEGESQNIKTVSSNPTPEPKRFKQPPPPASKIISKSIICPPPGKSEAQKPVNLKSNQSSIPSSQIQIKTEAQKKDMETINKTQGDQNRQQKQEIQNNLSDRQQKAEKKQNQISSEQLIQAKTQGFASQKLKQNGSTKSMLVESSAVLTPKYSVLKSKLTNFNQKKQQYLQSSEQQQFEQQSQSQQMQQQQQKQKQNIKQRQQEKWLKSQQANRQTEHSQIRQMVNTKEQQLKNLKSKTQYSKQGKGVVQPAAESQKLENYKLDNTQNNNGDTEQKTKKQKEQQLQKQKPVIAAVPRNAPRIPPPKNNSKVIKAAPTKITHVETDNQNKLQNKKPEYNNDNLNDNLQVTNSKKVASFQQTLLQNKKEQKQPSEGDNSSSKLKKQSKKRQQSLAKVQINYQEDEHKPKISIEKVKAVIEQRVTSHLTEQHQKRLAQTAKLVQEFSRKKGQYLKNANQLQEQCKEHKLQQQAKMKQICSLLQKLSEKNNQLKNILLSY